MSESQNPVQSYRILIVDDIPTVREGLRWLFENEPDFTIIGEAGDGREAVRQAAELAPDLIILDIELPLLNGFEVTQSIKTLPSPPFVVLLSIHGDTDTRRRGTEAGCDGFIEKSAGWPQLLATVRQVLSESDLL